LDQSTASKPSTEEKWCIVKDMAGQTKYLFEFLFTGTLYVVNRLIKTGDIHESILIKTPLLKHK